MARNTSKYRANTFGFYPINGREVVEFMEHSTSKYVCEFLRTIRDKNPVVGIIILLDNARSHIAEATKKFAESLGIVLVFIPPYSPDLNPIEQIWKGIRRRISQVFVKSEWAFRETIRTTFHRLAKKPSFMENWLKVFQPVLSNLL
ncbi:MAG: transposase [Candidatus Altiarchaeales archaeon IMC4]|nr:MAG: transposase [Candidatus Altiarchaeales archaeon IMC4]